MDSSTLRTPPGFGRKLATVFVLLGTVLLASLFACFQVRADASAAAAAMREPQLIVSLARSNIEESDQLPVAIEISNDSDTDLTAITLRVGGEFQNPACAAAPLPLAPAQPPAHRRG